MSDDPTPEDDGLDDESFEAERRATFRQYLAEADEADVILLTGMSRADWLMQLDQAAAEDAKINERGWDAGRRPWW